MNIHVKKILVYIVNFSTSFMKPMHAWSPSTVMMKTTTSGSATLVLVVGMLIHCHQQLTLILNHLLGGLFLALVLTESKSKHICI